jgi:CheY-like chemotaxis protein
MKILVVDDTLRHRRAARAQLEALGHEVILTSDYTEARALAKRHVFDAVLLDLLMPAEGATLGTAAREKYFGVETGIGFPLVLDLSRYVKQMVLATDTNHHDHPLSAAVDWFIGPPLSVNGARVLIMHAPMTEGVKNWAEMLERLLAP